MSYKNALIIVILASALFLLYIWKFGFPPIEDEGLQEPKTSLREPDSLTPAAGICDYYDSQQTVVFEVEEGIPSPRCARVLSGQIIAFKNSTSQPLLFEFAGRPFAIEPGQTISDERRAEDYLLPGVHVVNMDFYGGSGPEIWVSDTRTFEISGTITQQFVSAKAIVIETQSGEISLGLTDETRILTPSGQTISLDEFALNLTTGTQVEVIANLPLADTGTAYVIRIEEPINEEPVACTLEAKLCPDGSAVGRVGPNCEFAPCPGE